MLEVVALTGGETLPSARFRIRQMIPPLLEGGIRVHEYYPFVEKDRPVPFIPSSVKRRWIAPAYVAWETLKLAGYTKGILASRRNGLTWLQRELLGGVRSLEPFLGSPLVFDVDDAIWLGKPDGRHAATVIADRAEIIVAGNRYLAEWFGENSRSRIEIIPTAIDTTRFVPSGTFSQEMSMRFVVGWTGVSGNLAQLSRIERALKNFMNKYDDVELHVLCDMPPDLKGLPRERVKHIPWHEQIEASELREWSVGIMPLDDSEFSRGKCSFKMLQYMATGLPVVVSPVGMNLDVLSQRECGFGAKSDSDWLEMLEWLYLNPANARLLGQAGRELVEEEYSIRVNVERLRCLFLQLN